MNKKLKLRRGFSLVELMVVVAIMGTLAAIAIPAYNEYRKAAKKTAYKTDLLGFHKGMLAFGVELDSFCERETSPETATIGNIGMASLTSSKLYGVKGMCGDNGNAGCNNPADSSLCAGSASTAICTTNSATVAGRSTGCACVWNTTAGNGPGKHNFIGFGATATGCNDPNTNAQLDVAQVQILGESGGTPTAADGACILNVTSYDLGVYGHISGTIGYGVSIDNNGVLSDEDEATLAATANSEC